MADEPTFEQDYMQRPEETREERLRRLVSKQREREARLERLAAISAKERELEEAERGVIADVGAAVISGPLRAFEEMGQTVAELGDWLDSDAGYVVFGGDSLVSFQSREEAEAAGVSTLADLELNGDLDAQTTAGGVVQGIGQFLTGWATGGRLVKLAKGGLAARTGTAMARGAVVDATAFDPHEDRLSDLVQQYPALQNPITDYLEAEDDDSTAEGRFKNALEGLGLGAITDGFFLAVKGIRAARRARALEELDVPETPLEPARELVEESVEEAPEATARAADEAAPEAAAEAVEDVAEEVPVRFFEISDEARRRIGTAIESGNMSEARELLDFNDARIDWEALGEEATDIRQLLNTVSEEIAGAIDVAKGGVQTNAETVRMANLVGLRRDQVGQLFEQVRGGPGLTARILAADRTMLASARRLRQLAIKAKETHSREDLSAFHRQVELHAAIQAEVKGAKTEVGRALQAMSIMKRATAEQFHEFDETVRRMGGHGQNTDKLLQKFIDSPSLEDINLQTRRTAGRRIIDAITEVAINGMLSSPKTHLINISSNSLQAGVGVAERWIAAGIGSGYRGMRRLLGSDAAVMEFQEALAFTRGTAHGIRRGTRLAAQALKERRPVSDPVQRIEFETRRAIRIDTEDLSGAALTGAKAFNVLGEVIRAPGTALVVEDEFFKSIGEQAALASAAFRRASRTASKKGLKGSKRSKFIAREEARLLADPPTDLQVEAKEFARYQTFQEPPRTEFGAATERWLNSHPVFKLIVAPFVRTPLNILRQVFLDRTPLGLLQQELRDTIARGGPEAQLAIARMTVGTSALLAGYELAESGRIRGGGESYFNTERLDGVREYSIQTADGTWVQFNRLDPIGSWLAMSADFHDSVRRYYDAEDPASANAFEAYSTAIVLAVSRNALSKTWMQSFEDITNAIMSEQGPDAQSARIRNLTASQLQKLVPYSSFLRATTQAIDPVQKEALDIGERIQRGLPWQDGEQPLSAARDYLGREIRYDTAPLYWLNPFTVSTESEDPLDLALADLSYEFQPVGRKLDGVDLTSQQRSEFKRLIGQEPYPQFGGRTLEEYLRDFVQSPEYERLSESDYDTGGREYAVKRIYSAARQLAKQRLLQQEPELAQSIRDRRVRAANLRSQREPSLPGSTTFDALN